MNEEAVQDKHILIAADETDNGLRAALYVADMLGGQPGFRATVLHVVSEPDPDFFASEDEEMAWRSEQQQKGQELVSRYRDLLMQAGFNADKVAMEVLLKRSETLAESILEEVERLDACTVVVGRRGLSSKEEFLLGSTSNRLVHTARNCAVWVVD